MKDYVDRILKKAMYIIIFGHKDLDGITAVHQFIKYVEINHVHIKIIRFEFCNYALSKIDQIKSVILDDDITYVFLDLNISFSEIKHINKFIFLDHHSTERVLEVANDKQVYYKSVYTKSATMIVNDLHYNKIYNHSSKLVNAFDTGKVDLCIDTDIVYNDYEYVKIFYDEILIIYKYLNKYYNIFGNLNKSYNFENLVVDFNSNISDDKIILLFDLCKYRHITEYIVSALCKYVYEVLKLKPYLMLFIIDNKLKNHYKISIRSDSKQKIDQSYLKNCIGIPESYGHDSARACFWDKSKINKLENTIKLINQQYKQRIDINGLLHCKEQISKISR